MSNHEIPCEVCGEDLRSSGHCEESHTRDEIVASIARIVREWTDREAGVRKIRSLNAILRRRIAHDRTDTQRLTWLLDQLRQGYTLVAHDRRDVDSLMNDDSERLIARLSASVLSPGDTK